MPAAEVAQSAAEPSQPSAPSPAAGREPPTRDRMRLLRDSFVYVEAGLNESEVRLAS